MLQGEPAPRPASKSPPEDINRSSPAQAGSRPAILQQDEPFGQRQALGTPTAADEERRPPSAGPRSSGFQNILNPSEPRRPYDSRDPQSTRRSEEGGSPQPSMAPQSYGAGGPPTAPYPYHGSQLSQAPASAYSPVLPSTSSSQALSSTPERRPPTPTQPYLPLTGARRILTPRSPRAASLGRAVFRSGSSPPPPPPLPPYAGTHEGIPSRTISPRTRAPPLGTPQQLLSLGQGPGLPSTAPSVAGAVPRSFSQPLGAHVRSAEHPQEPLPPVTRAPVFSSGPTYPSTPALPAGAVPTSRPPNDARWSTTLLGQMHSQHLGSRNMTMEGQHLLTITPSHGEEIVVPVDIHQASKQADEKRQRNAGASARFRQRKKEREKEQQHGLQKLETANRDLQTRLQDMEAERDYYRQERNRLREIVTRTPSISEWADRGPPSPTSTRSGASFAMESAPMPGPPPRHLHAPASYPPGGESSTQERPARRRKTDPEPRFTTPSYGPPLPAPSTTLPPIPGSSTAYGINPPHATSGPPEAARLAPLRIEQPSPMSELAPGVAVAPSTIPPPQTQVSYPPYSRAAYETTWTVAPKGSQEGGDQR